MQVAHKQLQAIRRLTMCPAVALAGVVLWVGCAAPSRKGAPMAKPQFESPGPSGQGKEEAAMADPRKEKSSPASIAQQKHAPRLMAIDGVLGVGVGQDPIGNESIVVYVRDQGVARNVPRDLDGISTQVQVTGPIEALKR